MFNPKCSSKRDNQKPPATPSTPVAHLAQPGNSDCLTQALKEHKISAASFQQLQAIWHQNQGGSGDHN